MANRLTIGAVAHHVGIRPSAVRFYERQGLVASERLANGYRVYDREALSALRFISRAKALGFSLTEIGEILEVKRNGVEPCGCVKALIERNLRTSTKRSAHYPACGATYGRSPNVESVEPLQTGSAPLSKMEHSGRQFAHSRGVLDSIRFRFRR